MNDPNDEVDHVPNDESLGDDFNEFERSLAKRSLGNGTGRHGELMYECGYAAGVSATQRSNRGTIIRWRGIGLAASVLACISSVAVFSKIGSDRLVELGEKQQSSPSLPKATGAGSSPVSDPWIALATQDRKSGEASHGILRASGTLHFDSDPEQLNNDSIQPGPIQQEPPLRPRDFNLFL